MTDEPTELLARLRVRPDDPDLQGRLSTWARSEGRGGGLVSQWLPRAQQLGPDLLALALDAHALGLLDRQRARELYLRKASVPVVAIREAMIVFLAGEQDVEVLDDVLPAAVQRAIGQKATWMVVDVSAAVLDETLAHTLSGLCRIGIPDALRLGVSGAESTEWVDRCRALCEPPQRLTFLDHVGSLPALAAEEAAR